SVLISTSIENLAANIPGQLLVELVKAGLWPPARGLAFARRMRNRGRLGEVLTALAPHLLEERLLSEAISAARAIEHEVIRDKVLTVLATQLQMLQKSQAFAEAFTAVQVIGRPEARRAALTGVAT